MKLRNLQLKGLKLYFARLTKQLVEDSSPQKTALTLTLGFYLSLFPVVGSTTFLCLLATFLFRLNPFIIQGVNFFLFPIQMMLMFPFLKAGRMLFFTRKDLLPAASLKQLMHVDGWDSFYYLFESLIGGIAMWGIFSAITGFLLYKILLKLNYAR